MSFGAIAIHLKRALKSAFGIVGALLSQVRFTDPQVQVGEMRIRLFGSQQTCQGSIQVSFLEVNRAHEQVDPGEPGGVGGGVCGGWTFCGCLWVGGCFGLHLRLECDELMQQCFRPFAVTSRESALREVLQKTHFVGSLGGELLKDGLRFREAS